MVGLGPYGSSMDPTPIIGAAVGGLLGASLAAVIKYPLDVRLARRNRRFDEILTTTAALLENGQRLLAAALSAHQSRVFREGTALDPDYEAISAYEKARDEINLVAARLRILMPSGREYVANYIHTCAVAFEKDYDHDLIAVAHRAEGFKIEALVRKELGLK